MFRCWVYRLRFAVCFVTFYVCLLDCAVGLLFTTAFVCITCASICFEFFLGVCSLLFVGCVMWFICTLRFGSLVFGLLLVICCFRVCRLI